MSTTDSIESLFKMGTIQINFGKSPDGDCWLAEVRQLVETGEKGQTHLVHQISGPSVVACLEKAKIQVAHANVLPIPFNRTN